MYFFKVTIVYIIITLAFFCLIKNFRYRETSFKMKHEIYNRPNIVRYLRTIAQRICNQVTSLIITSFMIQDSFSIETKKT